MELENSVCQTFQTQSRVGVPCSWGGPLAWGHGPLGHCGTERAHAVRGSGRRDLRETRAAAVRAESRGETGHHRDRSIYSLQLKL